MSNPSDVPVFSFVGISKVMTKTSAFVLGTQVELKSLYKFLESHKGKKIKVTYEVAEE